MCTENLVRAAEVRESPKPKQIPLRLLLFAILASPFKSKCQLAMDLFLVPTVGFKLLYVLVIVRLDRRALVWVNVTQNPTAE